MASHFLRYSVLLQKYRTPLLVTSCGGIFAANLFTHVFPEWSFRPLYQAWFKGQPASLSEKLEDVFQQVVSIAVFKKHVEEKNLNTQFLSLNPLMFMF